MYRATPNQQPYCLIPICLFPICLLPIPYLPIPYLPIAYSLFAYHQESTDFTDLYLIKKNPCNPPKNRCNPWIIFRRVPWLRFLQPRSTNHNSHGYPTTCLFPTCLLPTFRLLSRVGGLFSGLVLLAGLHPRWLGRRLVGRCLAGFSGRLLRRECSTRRSCS